MRRDTEERSQTKTEFVSRYLFLAAIDIHHEMPIVDS